MTELFAFEQMRFLAKPGEVEPFAQRADYAFKEIVREKKKTITKKTGNDGINLKSLSMKVHQINTDGFCD